MERLSREFLEKMAIDKKFASHRIRDNIDQELRRLVEEIAKRHTK